MGSIQAIPDTGLQTHDLRNALPLVAEGHLGASWAESP